MAKLALVTCGPQVEVALANPRAKGVSVLRLAGVSRRSSLLLAAVDLLVEDGGLEPSDISTVVVSRGPGSFTGIRAGLATALGLARATGAGIVAYDSLLMQAARAGVPGEVWAAQPGRRGELYARRFEVDGVPAARGEIEVVPVAEAAARGRWIAPEVLDLGGAERHPACRTAAEALLDLEARGIAGEAEEPFYFEDPPVHQPAGAS